MSWETDPELAMEHTRAVLEAGCRQGWHLGAQLSVHVRGMGGGHVSVGERRPGEPMTDDTLLRWWSAGKPLTALAVAQQVERGALVLDHPVAHWIPEFAAAGKERVSIRHLLTHCSGMRMAEALPEGLGEEEILAWICALPLGEGVAAGEGAAYDPQAAWQVLAELVTRAGGRPFADLVRSGILEPLGMRDTWLSMNGEIHRAYGSRVGTTYVTFSGAPVPHTSGDGEAACAPLRAGSSVRGPVRDLLRFQVAMRDGGGGVIAPELLAEFTRRQREGRYDRTFRHIVDFGLGFLVNSARYGPSTVPYGYGERASEEAFGHSGSQSACGFADPERGVAVAWVCNGMPGEPRHQRRVRAIHEALEADLAGGGFKR